MGKKAMSSKSLLLDKIGHTDTSVILEHIFKNPQHKTAEQILTHSRHVRKLGISTNSIGEVMKSLARWKVDQKDKDSATLGFVDWLETGADIHHLSEDIHDHAIKLMNKIDTRLKYPDAIILATALEKSAQVLYCVDSDFATSDKLVSYCRERKLEIKRIIHHE